MLTILFWWFIASVAALLFFYGPSLYLAIRYVVEDINFNVGWSKRENNDINPDGLAFNGNWYAILVALAVLFILAVILMV